MIACPECGHVFRRHSQLDEHLAWHSLGRSPEPSPFKQAERMLAGRRWSDAEADQLVALVRIGAPRSGGEERSIVAVPMSAVLAKTTIALKVTGLYRARVRMWMGIRLMRIAALVIGCKIDLDLTKTAEKNAATHDCCATTHGQGPLPSD